MIFVGKGTLPHLTIKWDNGRVLGEIPEGPRWRIMHQNHVSPRAKEHRNLSHLCKTATMTARILLKYLTNSRPSSGQTIPYRVTVRPLTWSKATMIPSKNYMSASPKYYLNVDTPGPARKPRFNVIDKCMAHE